MTDELLPDLDPEDERPVIQQIAAVVRDAIESGRLRPGDAVPGENTLMRRYGVARWTAREALAILAETGLVTKIRAKGTYVRGPRQLLRRPRRYQRRGASPFAMDAREAGRDPGTEAVSDRTTASSDVASRLGIEPGAEVVRTTYRFLADGQPIQSSVSYEPYELTAATDVESPEEGPLAGAGVIARMDRIGQRVVKVSEEVSVRPPTAAETSSLAIPRSVHVFQIRRTHFTAERPVETCDIVIPGDRYALVYEIAVPDQDEPDTRP
jgi:DNA-binding GntR family transcriptional regulator